MSWIDGLRARLGLLASKKHESRIDDEMRFHIDMEAERLVRDEGLTPTEARRRALAAFGGVTQHRETLRDGRGLAWLTGLTLDLRLGVRMLVRYPGLTAVGTLALAVAIAVGAGYFDFLRALYRPRIPIPHIETLVAIRVWNASGRTEDDSFHGFATWRTSLRTLDLAASRRLTRTLVAPDGSAALATGDEITASAVRVIGLRPALGRMLLDDDERPDAPPVVLLSHRTWHARLGADSAIVDRLIRLGGSSYTVVGVMPEQYATSTDFWIPLNAAAIRAPRIGGWPVRILGRLANGATVEEARAELNASRWREPTDTTPLRAVVKPYIESALSDPESVMERRILYGANLFFFALLALCGANIATLVFARIMTRQGEMTVRTALGAARSRIVVQFFAEGLVLATVAGALGLAIATAAQQGLKRFVEAAQGEVIPWLGAGLSVTTYVYAGVLVVATAVLIGVVPALKATGPSMIGRLKDAAGGSTARFPALWTGVIVAQVACTALFLLICGTVAWNAGAGRYLGRVPAVAANQYLTADVGLDSQGDLPPATYDELTHRIGAERGVSAVTYGSALPGMNGLSMRVEVDALAGDTTRRRARFAMASTDFFQAFDARVVAGRVFSPGDAEPGRLTAVVDETFQREIIGGRNAVGLQVRRVTVGGTGGEGGPPDVIERGPWMEIVGVVRDLSVSADTQSGRGILYLAASAANVEPRFIAVRSADGRAMSGPALMALAGAVEPRLQLTEVMTLRDLGRSDRLVWSVISRVMVVIACLALLLSTAGIYAVMSFTVARRTREIGLRAALGADSRQIVTSTFSGIFAKVLLGIAIGSLPGGTMAVLGIPEAANGAGWIRGLAMFAGVTSFMIAVALVSCAVPMRRALGIQPTEALRSGG